MIVFIDHLHTTRIHVAGLTSRRDMIFHPKHVLSRENELTLSWFCQEREKRENELRERIPVPHDNFLKSI